jgi:hypothetical protein
MILLRKVLNVIEIRDGWKLYIVAGDVMVRMLLNERAQREEWIMFWWPPECNKHPYIYIHL